jgi:hypothetical protein
LGFERRMRMKNLLVVLTVLSIASIANANLWLSVDGQVNPSDTIILAPSNTAVIGVFSDGLELCLEAYFLYIEGPGTSSVLGAINNINSNTGDFPTVIDISEAQNGTEIFLDMATPIPEGIPMPYGTVIDQIIFHCEAPGDVTLTLTGDVSGVFDTQVIHQIPEPMTIGLLGLGGLFLRRRR